MRKNSVGLGIMGILSLVVFLGGFFQTGEDLFQKALRLERNEGKLEEAIGLYNQVVERSKDKTIAARAQFRIGVCYEELGDTMAIKAYEAVLSRFPKEAEIVAEARSRLAALRKEQSGGLAKTRLVLPDTGLEVQTLSPDGTKLAGIKITREGQNIGVFDLAAKKTKMITNFPDGEMNCLTCATVWSPDSKEIAYWASCLEPLNEEGPQLRTSTLDGKSRLLFRNTEGTGIAPCAWLPDKSAIVAFVGEKDQSYSLNLISTKDGSRRQLFHLRRKFRGSDISMVEASNSAAVSPDGRFIVFSDGPSDGNRDIYIIGKDGGSPVILTEHPADDKEPRWSPDGRYIVFLSLRHGSWALWGIDAKDGKPNEQPFIILEGMQNTELAAWTTRGLASRVTAHIHDLYTAEIDPETHELRGRPKVVDFSPAGTNICPVWSPDGRYLAFVSSSVDQENEGFLVVMPSKGGEPKKYKIPTTNFSSMSLRDVRWLPDSSGLGFSQFDNENRYSLFRLDLTKGEWETTQSLGMFYTSIEWGNDGQTLIYAKGFVNPAEDGILERKLDSGEERYILHSEMGLPPFWAMKASRDHKKLAKASENKIELIDCETGKVTGLEWEETNLTAPAWSNDGNYLVARGKVGGAEIPDDLFIISVQDRTLKPLKISQYLPPETLILQPDWSPDGKTIAFFTRTWKTGTYVIQNVIPKK